MTTSPNHDQEGQSHKVAPTPLPKFQLSLVALIQLAEPITATVIYPFIAPLIALTGINRGDEKAIGYYAGIIESVFFFTESASVYHWALASDYYGRKPVLVLGPIGLGISTIAFGLTTNFWSLVVLRAVQGCFNGLIGVSKTVMSEMTDSTNVTAAFSMISLMWSTGVTIGPLIGGLLANPAWHWAFFDTPFFHQYPFFLPCAAAGVLCLISSALAIIYLEETSPKFKKQKRISSNSETTPLIRDSPADYASVDHAQGSESADVVEAPPTIRELLTPSFVRILICYGFLAFLSMAYSVLLPLVYSSSYSLGGLEFPPSVIGKLMASVAIGGGLVQIFFLPKIMKRYDERTVFFVAMSCIGTSTMCLGALSWVVRRSGGVNAAVWILIVIQQVCGLTSYAAYTSMQVLIVGSATRTSVASANSIAQMISTLVRGLSPSIASSLYSVSLSKNLLGGYFVYLVLGSLYLVCLRITLALPKTR